MTNRIAIQGFEGSFHHAAAGHFFGKQAEVHSCVTFKELVQRTSGEKTTGAAVMAIENSIAGSILSNYHLLQKSKLKITGEIYMQVKQQLLVNPGVQLADIREVHSHTMALQQCGDFLDKHKWKLVETDDTALSARYIHRHKSKHIATIASKLAAGLYDLKILAPDIHSLKNNYTRFLVLCREDVAETIPGADKASINFHTDHSKGSLAKVLTKIADGGINLSKLQSFPIPVAIKNGSDFKYSFHADMEFDNSDRFYEVIAQLKRITEGLTIYGVYKKGVWK